MWGEIEESLDFYLFFTTVSSLLAFPCSPFGGFALFMIYWE